MSYDPAPQLPSMRSLRADDRQREATAERLAAHAAAGRLSVDELEARVAAAHNAVYAGDLEALEADLPDLAPERRRARRRPPLVAWPVLPFLLVALAVVTSLLVGHPVVGPLILTFVLLRFARRPGRHFLAGKSVS